LVKSTDGGATFAAALTTFGVVRGIVVDPQDSNVVYVAGFLQLEFGEPYPTDVNLVLRSTDAGATFTPADAGLPPTGLIVGIAIDPRTPSRLFLWGAATGLFETEDGGSSWSGLDAAGETFLRSGSGTTLAISPTEPRLLYLGGLSLLEVD